MLIMIYEDLDMKIVAVVLEFRRSNLKNEVSTDIKYPLKLKLKENISANF